MGKVYLFGPYPPPYGGVATYVYILFKWLNRSDIDTTLIPYQEPPKKGDSIEPNSKSIFNFFSSIKKHDICLDSCSFFLEYPISIGAIIIWLYLKKVKGFKWIKIIHDSTLPYRYPKFGIKRKCIAKITLTYIDEFIVVNDEIKAWLLTNTKIDKKIQVIPSLLPIPDDTNQSRIDNNSLLIFDKVICTIGTFIPTYGFDQIAKAVEIIREKLKLNVGLIIIDGGFSKEEGFKELIMSNRDWITVKSNQPHEEVIDILLRSDVFVRGTQHESYGLSRIEALWCGIQVVATDVGETRGMSLYKFGDIEQLSRLLSEAIMNNDENKSNYWSDFFKAEAVNNLQRLLEIVQT